jgi:hypothetical protein
MSVTGVERITRYQSARLVGETSAKPFSVRAAFASAAALANDLVLRIGQAIY